MGAGGALFRLALDHPLGPHDERRPIRQHKTSQALVFGKAAVAAVGEFYAINHRLPGTLAEASFVTPMPGMLDDVQFNTTNGVLRLVLASGSMAGRVVQFVPSIDVGGRMLWRCEAGTAEPKYLHMECRH